MMRSHGFVPGYRFNFLVRVVAKISSQFLVSGHLSAPMPIYCPLMKRFDFCHPKRAVHDYLRAIMAPHNAKKKRKIGPKPNSWDQPPLASLGPHAVVPLPYLCHPLSNNYLNCEPQDLKTPTLTHPAQNVSNHPIFRTILHIASAGRRGADIHLTCQYRTPRCLRRWLNPRSSPWI